MPVMNAKAITSCWGEAQNYFQALFGNLGFTPAMKGKWLLWARRAHLFLGVFFSPLLLMFVITGWWQTVTTDDEKEAAGGFVHNLLEKLSSVHTEDSFPRPGADHHSPAAFKVLVVTMCLALIAAIGLGLVLAWQLKKKWMVGLAFILGILLPALLLYFA
jgi:hypothetical protein